MGWKMDKIQKLTINSIVLISFTSATFTDELKEIIESMEINEWVGKWIKFKNLLLVV